MTFVRKSLIAVCVLLFQVAFGLDRQPNADYHSRRQGLATKTGGAAVLLFASAEEKAPTIFTGTAPITTSSI